MHSKNTQLITDNPAVDISIGGGNDIAGRPTIINGTQYLINPSKHGEALNQINVVVLNGKMTGVIYSQIFLTDAYAEDPTVKALVDSYNDEVAASLEKVVGYSAQNLEWSTQLVRGQNSPIANLVTDALLDFFAIYEPDICLVNGGGIRASMPEGPVTLKSCNSVLPFDNDMMLVEGLRRHDPRRAGKRCQRPAQPARQVCPARRHHLHRRPHKGAGQPHFRREVL